MKQAVNQKHSLSMSEIRGIILVVIGLSALRFYYSWWFEEVHLRSLLLLFGFVIALFYVAIQIIGNWLMYLATHYRPQTPPAPIDALTVDVFVTACGEEYTLIERALTAACAM